MPPRAKTDAELSRAALAKLAAGQPVPRRERLALERVKADQRQRLVDELLVAFPKKIYCQAAGLHSKTLHMHARKFGVPCATSPINLGDIIKYLHGLLAAQGDRLVGDDDELLAGPSSPNLERCRREKFLLLRMERLEREGLLLHTSVISPAFDLIASHLAEMCRTCETQFGPAAGDLWRSALREASDIATAFFDSIDAADDALDEEPTNGEGHVKNGSKKSTKNSASKRSGRQQRKRNV
jgi:hypothetical protein